MIEVQRVRLKKIYVWRAALVGLVIGAILGIVIALFFSIASFLAFSSLTFLGKSINSLLGGALVTISILIIAISAVFSAFVALISSFLYNIIAAAGINLHFLFEEHEELQKENKSAMSVNEFKS